MGTEQSEGMTLFIGILLSLSGLIGLGIADTYKSSGAFDGFGIILIIGIFTCLVGSWRRKCEM